MVVDLRNLLYRLDLAISTHLKTYEELLFLFIKSNEGERFYVYKDIKGNKTVSVGYNMDALGAKKIWQQIFAN